MSIKALQDYTFTSRYAKYLKNKKRRETWSETVNRVKKMMMDKYIDYPEVHKDIEFAYEMMRKKRVLGSQRALQFGGEPILRKPWRIFNCTSSYCDRLKFFQECMYLLLLGCGTGFSVQKHHIKKLPKLLSEKKQQYKKFTIPDTIEGWADAIGVLVSSYFNQSEIWEEYTGYRITFDFSEIRPSGSPISYGGKAPGSDALKNALLKIKDLLDKAIERQDKKLKPIDAYDIVMHASDAVLSGGVRRSSTIAIFSEDDEEMMNCKTGNWFNENPQRGRSNNSVLLLKKDLTKAKLDNIIGKIKEFGEPAFLLANDYEHIVNPCVRGSTLVNTKNGKTQIDLLVGQKVEIWNGFEWSEVLVRITGYEQQMKKVVLEDGRYLVCTNYHYWLTPIKNYPNDYIRTKTKDLCEGDWIWQPDGEYKILSIEDVGIDEKVYCFEEPKRNLAEFNGIVTGNCVEISFYAYNSEGLSGWESCNLSVVNCSRVKTKEDFLESCKAATIIGTLQAGFTEDKYLGKVSQEIVEREALLGVSMTGIMDSPDICLNPEIQSEAASYIKLVNEEIAKKINIRCAARTTCIKPEGSSSCVLGTSSGIHPHHAKRYIRRVQSNKLETIYQFFKTINPRACEESVWSNNGTDDVISFCIEVPDGSKTKNQIGALELLQHVRDTQRNWVTGGKNAELCTQPWLTHNVSNTISVKPEEWDSVAQFIFDNREDFCGVSLLPVTGDKDYPQAPFTSIYLPEEMVKFYGDGVMFVSGLIEQALSLFEDNLWKASEFLLGLNSVKGSSKKDWIDRCKKFAGKYFNNDLRKLSYCMKDVYNYKLWTELQQEYKAVDFEEMIEEEDNTKVNQEIACAGGSCELK